MSEVKWIKITTDMFEDEKIEFISSLPEADALLVIWIRLLTMAGRCNAGGYVFLTENIPYTEEMLAHKFRKPINIIKLALETFRRLGMIDFIDNKIYVTNFSKHQNVTSLERIREQTRIRVAKYREKLKIEQSKEENVTLPATLRNANVTHLDIDIDIDKDINNMYAATDVAQEHQNDADDVSLSNSNEQDTKQSGTNRNSATSKEEYTPEFEQFWTFYPRKIEKKRAYRQWKARLKEKVSPEDLIKAAKHYAEYCKKRNTEPEYIKHASTFLSRDKPYEEFTNHEERQTDTPKSRYRDMTNYDPSKE